LIVPLLLGFRKLLRALGDLLRVLRVLLAVQPRRNVGDGQSE
jgi:hypothetical protein